MLVADRLGESAGRGEPAQRLIQIARYAVERREHQQGGSLEVVIVQLLG